MMAIGFSAQDTPESIQIDEVVPRGLDAADWITAGVVLAVSIVLAIAARRLVTRALRAQDTPVGVARLVGRFLGAMVFAGGLVYVLSSLGIRIGPVLGALGIVGIALAFALQDILENFVAGILLQTRRPFAIGDQIDTNDYQGTVEDVNTRAVVMRTFDGERVVIPSAMVFKSPIHNHTAFDRRRTTVVVGVSYEARLAEAREVMLRAARQVDGVLNEPTPEAYLEELGESGVNYALRFWHEPGIADLWQVRDRVIEAVFDAFGQAEIEIPFPQRTVHLRRPASFEPTGPGAGAGAEGS